jgi:hypothetical protein
MRIPQPYETLQVDETLTIEELGHAVNHLIQGRIREILTSPYDSEPDPKAAGMVVWADGTNWDPGSGVGLYEYDGSTWNKL